MKLLTLFESALTPRQVFLRFQQQLIELDDGFEQDDPVSSTHLDAPLPQYGSSIITYHFFRPQKSALHDIRFIDIKCYIYEGVVEDFNMGLYRSTLSEIHSGYRDSVKCLPKSANVVLTSRFPVISTVDEAMSYLVKIIKT